MTSATIRPKIRITTMSKSVEVPIVPDIIVPKIMTPREQYILGIQPAHKMEPSKNEYVKDDCCLPVNHFAHFGLTMLSCGLCLPCWLGACVGCTCCPSYNEF